MTLFWDKPEESGNIADVGTSQNGTNMSVVSSPVVAGSSYAVQAVYPDQLSGIYGRDLSFSDRSEVYFSLWHRFDDYPSGAGIWYILFTHGSTPGSGNPQCSIQVDPTGHYALYRAAQEGGTLLATGSTAFTPDTYRKLTGYVKIHNTEGRFVLKVDGVTEIDFTGDTQQLEHTLLSGMVIGIAKQFMFGGTPMGHFDQIQVADVSLDYRARLAFKLTIS